MQEVAIRVSNAFKRRLKAAGIRVVAAAFCFWAWNNFASVLYVNVNSTNAVPPFTNWSTAATSIQDAVDAAVDGDQVLVADGVYATGGQVLYGVTNRVSIGRAVTVESVHGPAAAIIQGYLDQGRMGPIFSPNCVRCAYVTNGAALIGFTLTNGATSDPGSGGGVYCESGAGQVSNCIFVSNSVPNLGGGACNGTLLNCVFAGNSGGSGGGAYGSVLSNCTFVGNLSGFYGGGADSSTLWNCIVCTNRGSLGGGAGRSVLNNCQLFGNFAQDEGGGGARDSELNNCLIVGNNGGRFGGGACHSTLNNCTVVGNYADWGGGVDQIALTNCIVYDNTCYFTNPNTRDAILDHCCTTPEDGPGSITNVPLFIDAAAGNFRLATNSPCINAGNNGAVTASTDLDGNARVRGGTVDIGGYEVPAPTSVISYAWLLQYGLPTDGSADYTDPDHDGHNNWQEWISGTDPTNSASVLKMQSPVATNDPPAAIIVSWQSVADRVYDLQRSTNVSLRPAFSLIQSNIPGQAGTTSFFDTNAPTDGPCFYRVNVH